MPFDPLEASAPPALSREGAAQIMTMVSHLRRYMLIHAEGRAGQWEMEGDLARAIEYEAAIGALLGRPVDASWQSVTR